MKKNDEKLIQAGDDVYLYIDSGASTTYKEAALILQHGSVTRWAIEKDNVANADLYIRRYNSSGVLQDNPILIEGDDGAITFAPTGEININASQVWTLAAADTISIDAGTTQHTANVITVNLDVNTASSTLLNGTIDVDVALTGSEAVKGIYFDMNPIAADADGTSLTGVDLLMTGVSTSRADLTGYKVAFDGTMDTGDTITGLVVDGSSFTGDDTAMTIHGVEIAFASLTDTDYATGEFNALDITMPAAYQGTDVASAIKATGAGAQVDILSGAGTIYAVDLTLGAATRGIFIDAGTTNQAADKNIIDINCDVEGNYSVNVINVNFDFETTGMAGTDTCSILTADINEVVVGTDGAIMYGSNITMTGFATGRADLVGHLVTLDGSKTAGDMEVGYKMVGTATINHSGEVLYGQHIDFSGLTLTDGAVYGSYLDVSMSNGSTAYGLFVNSNANTTASIGVSSGLIGLSIGSSITGISCANATTQRAIDIQITPTTADRQLYMDINYDAAKEAAYIIGSSTVTSGSVTAVRARGQGKAVGASTAEITGVHAQGIAFEALYSGTVNALYAEAIAKGTSTSTTIRGAMIACDSENTPTSIGTMMGAHIRTKTSVTPGTAYYVTRIENEKLATGVPVDSFIDFKTTTFAGGDTVGVDVIDTTNLVGTVTNIFNYSTVTCTSVFYSDCTATNFLETSADSKGGAGATRATPNQTATCDGSIVVKIGAKTLLIPLYNAVTIS